MKLTMGTSVIGGNLLRVKSDFIFDILVGLKFYISSKLNEKSDIFINRSN